MLDALLEVVIPVFAVAAAGFVYAGRRDLPLAALTDMIIHLTGACLVFDALTRAEPLSFDAAKVPLGAAMVMGGGVLLAGGVRRLVPGLRTLSWGAVAMPAAFMNAGNLGLPLTRLAFGDEGFRLGMLYFITMSSLMYSVGVGMVSGQGGVKTALRLPLLHAALLGVAFNLMGWGLPRMVEVPVHMLGQTVVPMMLLSLGGRLRSLLGERSQAFPWGPVLTLTVLRMGGGALLGWAVNALLGNQGDTARVVLLVSMLPPAVMNFAVVEKFGGDPKASAVVSGTIAVATALAVLVLPFAVDGIRAAY